jgi:hypothetical protein
LARLCLDRRIPTLEQLETKILAFFTDRDSRNVKITWQFSIPAARTKLNAHYTAVQPDNAKFKSS